MEKKQGIYLGDFSYSGNGNILITIDDLKKTNAMAYTDLNKNKVMRDILIPNLILHSKEVFIIDAYGILFENTSIYREKFGDVLPLSEREFCYGSLNSLRGKSVYISRFFKADISCILETLLEISKKEFQPKNKYLCICSIPLDWKLLENQKEIFQEIFKYCQFIFINSFDNPFPDYIPIELQGNAKNNYIFWQNNQKTSFLEEKQWQETWGNVLENVEFDKIVFPTSFWIKYNNSLAAYHFLIKAFEEPLEEGVCIIETKDNFFDKYQKNYQLLTILQGIHQFQRKNKIIKVFPFFEELEINKQENKIEYEISSFFIKNKEKYIFPLLEKLTEEKKG